MLRTSSTTRSLQERLPTHCSSCGCTIHSHGLDLHPKFMRDFFNSDSELLHSTIVAEVKSASSNTALLLSNPDELPSCLSSALSSSFTSSSDPSPASSTTSLKSNQPLECRCSCHFNGKPVYPSSSAHFHPDDVHPKVLREIENHGTKQQREMLDALKHGDFKDCNSCASPFKSDSSLP